MEDEYYLEEQALRNGFGKMVNSIFKTNQTYSFSKAKRFSSKKITLKFQGMGDMKLKNVFFGS